MKCLECGDDLQDGKSLSNHIKRVHGISGEDYTIRHFYSGVRPLCKSCGAETRYVSFTFKEYCKEHANLKMSEAGRTGGQAPAWNRGLTKEGDDRILKQSLKMSGEGNPFWKKRHDLKTRRRISTTKTLGDVTLLERVSSRSSEFELMTPLEDYRSRQRQYLSFKCRACGSIQDKTLQAFERGSLCRICHPLGHSQWELELYEWVKSIVEDAKLGDRRVISPKEIDIWLPSHRLGIECHGLYYHSVDLDEEKNDHATKAELVDQANAKLLQVFWDEWRDKPEIIKSMISHRVGLSTERIGARACTVREANSQQQRKFFNESHISGYVPAARAWALFHGDRMVACLSVRRPRQKKWGDYLEVARFATLSHVSVVGGLSKLAKHAMSYVDSQGYAGLMTYVDMRVGQGSGYVQAGFEYVGKTGADYWYTDGDVRYDRFKFRAMNGKSERSRALEANVRKIWGVGNLIFVRKVYREA